MADADDNKGKNDTSGSTDRGGHSLADHTLGENFTHEHEGVADHDHDHFEFDEDGPIEENPIWLQDHVTLVSVCPALSVLRLLSFLSLISWASAINQSPRTRFRTASTRIAIRHAERPIAIGHARNRRKGRMTAGRRPGPAETQVRTRNLFLCVAVGAARSDKWVDIKTST